MFDLLEPEDVVPAWKRWSPILLRPEGLYGTRPAEGGNKAAKLRAIREALRTAKRVWLATDCDREGQLIGQEILEHYEYRGQVMRVLFTAQDSQTIRDAFGRAKPNAEYARGLHGQSRLRPRPDGHRVLRRRPWSLPSASNHRHQFALHVGVAVDVPLGGLDRPVTGEQLNVAQRAAGLVDEPGSPRDERAPA